jgi:hypothetical protein
MEPTDLPLISLPRLRSALESSWSPFTAYREAYEPGNPALGQCYPTARVVQWFFPRFDIVAGEVDTGSNVEAHFWNMDQALESAERIDLTWQQFPAGSRILKSRVLDRRSLGDSPPTVLRCRALLQRVLAQLSSD